MASRHHGNRARLLLHSVLAILLVPFVLLLALLSSNLGQLHSGTDSLSRGHREHLARLPPPAAHQARLRSLPVGPPEAKYHKMMVKSAAASAASPHAIGRMVVRDADGDSVMDDVLAADIARAKGERIEAEMISHAVPPTGGQFKAQEENSIKQTTLEPVSTFSVDVDTASYSYARRSLNEGTLPPPDSIKVEEFINYFDYSYPQPQNKSAPFEPSVLVSDSPWNKGRKLMHIGIKGYDLDPASRPFCNIVFLVDVSGSMMSKDKLPLAKTAMEALVKSELRADDLLSIVTYASSVAVPLLPTPAGRQERILSVIRSLTAGGATWGAGGIEKAYELAEENLDNDAVNRIILVTDGDFNVGLSDSAGLQKLIEDKRESGIFLSALGFGMGNYKDTTMKALANHGNGVAAYIDTIEEAKKVMVTEASSTVFPIAKDIKIQVEFKPAIISEYRLVGYEKRLLRNEDFNNDKVDAGDIGSGHTVTAIYEFTPVGSQQGLSMDPLRYAAKKEEDSSSSLSQEYAYLKIRYKLPNESESRLISRPISRQDHEEALLQQPIMDFRVPLAIQEFKFATLVAGFAQLLKGGRYMDHFSYQAIAATSKPMHDPHGYRSQFFQLVNTAQRMQQATAEVA